MELIASVLLAVIVVELYAWLPIISEWLLELAICQVRTEDQKRCREEWKAQLDDLPNTVVRLVHALSLIVAATRINMDFCQDKLDEFNQRLTDLHNLHRYNRGRIEGVAKMLESNIGYRHSVLDVQRKKLDASILNLDSMKSIQKPLNGFLEALHTCFAKTDSLLHGMIDKHTTKIKETDIVLHEARRAYDHIKRLSSRPMISSKSIMSLIDVLEKNLEQIDTDILQEDECPENDVPLEEYKRITSALERVCNHGKDGSSPNRPLPPGTTSN